MHCSKDTLHARSSHDCNLGSYKEKQASPVPNWLDGLVSGALHWYCSGHGFKSHST